MTWMRRLRTTAGSRNPAESLQRRRAQWGLQEMCVAGCWRFRPRMMVVEG